MADYMLSISIFKEMGGFYLTLFFNLSTGLLALFVIALFNLLISLSIDVGIGSDSIVFWYF